MKKYFIFANLIFYMVLFSSCEEEAIGQFPVDSTPPQAVTNVKVENLAGSAQLRYDLPDEKDLLYVKANFSLTGGNKKEAKASVFNNSMLIKGFGRSEKQTIQLISVDRSQNESAPVSVEIKPLDAPIYEIMKSLEVATSFGGFKLSWENPMQEDLVIGVLRKNDSTGGFSDLKNIYSSEAIAENAVRGLPSVNKTYGVYIRDTFNNYSDTLTFTIKPWYEQEIPKKQFKAMPKASIFTVHSWGKPTMSAMWDNINHTRKNVYFLRAGNEVMPYFTMDLGAKVKLSRFKLWQRSDYLYAIHNPKLYEWYGTNEVTVANDSESLDWQENPAWVKLGEFESKRPSGRQAGEDITAEDEAYAFAGEGYDFPADAPALRYLRFKLIKTWSNSSGLHISELSFWGEIEK